MREALRRISERDPQSPTCGPHAPEVCENGCIGCIARSALIACRNELVEVLNGEGDWEDRERKLREVLNGRS